MCIRDSPIADSTQPLAPHPVQHFHPAVHTLDFRSPPLALGTHRLLARTSQNHRRLPQCCLPVLQTTCSCRAASIVR
eukprot:830264-Alexandrium_andersonii.AAC.1